MIYMRSESRDHKTRERDRENGYYIFAKLKIKITPYNTM